MHLSRSSPIPPNASPLHIFVLNLGGGKLLEPPGPNHKDQAAQRKQRSGHHGHQYKRPSQSLAGASNITVQRPDDLQHAANLTSFGRYTFLRLATRTRNQSSLLS